MATTGAEDPSGSPAGSPRRRLNDCNIYRKFGKCIKLYKGSGQKRKRSRKHVSACCAGSQGARDCIKRHKTTTIDSDAREHTGSCEAFRQGDSDHLTFCSGESNSTSQLGRGHPTGNRVYSKGDNTSSSEFQPAQILCRQDQPVHIELEGTRRDPWVIQTIERGYTIPLITTPVQQSRPHSPHSSIKETELLQEEIQHLLQKQAVQEVPPNSRGFFPTCSWSPRRTEVRDLSSI